MVICVANLSEMLPYETRYLSMGTYTFAYSFTTAVAVNFIIIISEKSLIVLTFLNCPDFSLFYSYARDPICHLNIRNDVDVIERIIREEEQVLYDENPLEGKTFHDAVAKKIFEDLVYLDQDELKVSDFFKKIWKNWAMTEIIICLFQAISAGLHEFEYTHYINERFAEPLNLPIDKV
ncbi:hypothetical protein PFISCL1PPCAC_5344, partial [Pristionchus fissidentatus]